MKKWLKRLGMTIAAIVFLLIIWILFNLRDRHPGYKIDLTLTSHGVENQLSIGFSAFPITPDVVDTWNDINNDARYREEDGDTYNDNNNNGKFDAFWIAGFHNQRAANGVHDDVWARVIVFDDGNTRLALISLDAIGFRHDDVVDIRKRIPSEANIDYVIVSSTHTHESADLIGIWGKHPLKSGVNRENMEYVKSQATSAVLAAVSNLRPAKLKFAQDLTAAADLVMDTRSPIVLDPGLRIIQAIDNEADTTLGVLLSWANHPETLWSKNLLISSDFPHYFRECIEKGVYNGDTLVMEGLGGVAVYFNGAIGGLMTTRNSMPLNDPFSDTVYVESSFDKIRAQGQQLAIYTLKALERTNTLINKASISLQAKTIKIPLENNTFRLATMLGILDFGMSGWFNIRTEIAAFNIGPASFICIPGEIYPEIINGGVEAPDGQDYKTSQIEVPPLRELMTGDFKFVIGLANDEIGYIIPKSQWDIEAPYTFNLTEAPYGEENSVGPETAPILYKEISKLLQELK